jgi:hypothetical protein
VTHGEPVCTGSLHVEPVSRRIRAMLGGETVFDTTQAGDIDHDRRATMRFMVLVKANEDSEAGVLPSAKCDHDGRFRA